MKLNTMTWGDGPRTALLLHGVTSNAAGWWRLGPAIAEHGFTVTAPDLRGHGHSPKSADHLISAHAGDVKELAPTWDVVLGHSMGGAIAAVAASDNPAWTGQLILEDPAILFPDLPMVIAWLLPDFDGSVTSDVLQERNPDWPLQDAVTKADALAECGPEVVELAFTQNDPWDFRQSVAALEVPTTIIGADPLRGVIPTEFGEHLATSQHVTFTQIIASHSMHRDRWDEFWGVISGLLGVPNLST